MSTVKIVKKHNYFSVILNCNVITENHFWRATITNSDICTCYGGTVSGGTLSLVWNDKIGMLFSAAMPKYGMSESRNMQLSRYDDIMPNNAIRIKSGKYESVNSIDADLKCYLADGNIVFEANGNLMDMDFSSNAGYGIQYTFTADELHIRAVCSRDSEFVIPAICSASDGIDISGKIAVINRHRVKICIESTGNISGPDIKKRNFNVVGGFSTYPMTVKLKKDRPETVKISFLNPFD